MALEGSESQYAGSSSGQSKAQGAKVKPATFGSSIVAPPISGPMQNIVPGSQEWINARMATIIEQLKQRYGDAAAGRGMLQSGGSEAELAEAIAEHERQVQAEAAQYNAAIANREDTQLHEAEMAREAAKGQEKASMWSGLASMTPSLLFGKWNADKGGDLRYNPGSPAVPAGMVNKDGVDSWNPGSAAVPPSPMLDPLTGAQLKTDVVPGKSPLGAAKDTLGGAWNFLKENPISAGAAGTGIGTMLGSNKNKMTGLLAGGAATGLSKLSGMSGGATAGLSGLASGMFGSIKGNMFSKKNWWKTLLGGGALAGAAGLFGGGGRW